MKRLIGAAAALTLGLAAPLAVSVLPASASTVHTVHAGQVSAAQAHPKNDPSLGFDLFYSGGFELPIACVRGSNGDLTNPDPVSAINNCNVRVWLNENPDGTGYNFCISPGDTVNIHRSFFEVSITGNTTRCP
jgi:hypothetical protein